MELVLAIDLGTSYFKLGLFDHSGECRGLGRVAVTVDTDDGTRCELPAERFWSILRDALGRALSQAGADPHDIRAMAYSSQANSFLLLDAADQPLTPLLLWTDRRADVDEAVGELASRDDFLSTTGLGMCVDEAFAVNKLRWFQKHRPAVWSRTARVMTISDYLVYSLTGEAAGDAGTASLLGLLDLRKLDWWPAALSQLDIRSEQLSRPLCPGTVAGTVSYLGGNRLPLPEGIPLVAGSIDHHIASIGAGLGLHADLSESTGTVLACVRHADSFEPNAGVICGPSTQPGGYYMLNFDENGASVLEWYRNTHSPELSFEQLLGAAQGLPDGEDIPTARPNADRYPGLEGFTDRQGRHTHGHYVRAILESTARSLAALIDVHCPGGRPGRIVATGGGARSDFWLQLYADRLGMEVVAVQSDEPAVLGASILAATSAGWFPAIPEAQRAWVKIRRTFSPQ